MLAFALVRLPPIIYSIFVSVTCAAYNKPNSNVAKLRAIFRLQFADFGPPILFGILALHDSKPVFAILSFFGSN